MTKSQYKKHLIRGFLILNIFFWLSSPLLLFSISTNNDIAFIIWFIATYYIQVTTTKYVRKASEEYNKNKKKGR